jgi:signal peptidase I
VSTSPESLNPQDPIIDPTASETSNAGVEPDQKAKAIDWWGEVKGTFWLILAVLGFHSFLAKPFYIPSESMLPILRVGDRLVVSKYAYGWSHVSPTIPSPTAIFKWLVLREQVDSLAYKLPEWEGRIWGSMPERGDIVIVTPPSMNQDYIKRVIGLPGDRIEIRDGVVILNGQPLKRGATVEKLIPIDANTKCPDNEYPGAAIAQPDGTRACSLPFVNETLPNGRSYDVLDVFSASTGDNYGPLTVPDNHLFLMGDNRDHSADSRFSQFNRGLGGPVPLESIGGRAEFITFSLDGTSEWRNPLTWFSALRSGRSFISLAPQKDEQ